MKVKKTQQKPSQRLPDIISALHENETGMTTGEIASSLGIANSTAREILSAEVKRGNLRRVEVEDDGATVFKFFNVDSKNKDLGLDDLMATGDEIANTEQARGAPQEIKKEAKRGRKARIKSPDSGRGHPEAKKSINPQSTLEDKKEIAKELGGKMTWANRKWTITRKGDDDLVLSSREIASLTLVAFREKLGGL